MGVVGILHQSDEQLELYSLGRLPEPCAEELEEHLLICASCRERLDDVEVFALAMRRAVASEQAAHDLNPWFGWLRLWGLKKPALAWAGVFASIVLAASIYVRFAPNVAAMASLQLTAVRGGVESIVPARETDITLADAPPGEALRAQVVDSGGATVWRGAFGSSGQKIALTKLLPQGNYFVRLYDNTGKLLHEYGFRVRSVP